MKKIDSLQNPKIKELKKLNTKKYRNKTNKFMVENLVIISDAYISGYNFESLFITEQTIKKHPERINELVEKDRARVFLINEKVNSFFSELSTPSGIAAIYKKEEKRLKKGSVVFMNGISDPGNLGTIMRTTTALGIENIVLDDKCADVYNQKSISAAKDAIFKLNIKIDYDKYWIKKCKLPIYVADTGGSIDIVDCKKESSFCLVLGSESHGVSQEIVDMAKYKVKIDITGIESLNVAQAAAILLHELKNR